MKIIAKFLKYLKPEGAEKKLELIKPIYPIQMLDNPNNSETYLNLFLSGKFGGGGSFTHVFLEKEQKTEAQTAKIFNNLEELEQMAILYNYIGENSNNLVYIRKGYKAMADDITTLGYKAGKDIIEKTFKNLINKQWISEVIEMNKRYKLMKGVTWNDKNDK